MTVSGDLAAALIVHRAGRLAEADRLYARLLKSEPQNSELLRLRGVLACQEGRFGDAAASLREAVRLAAENPACHATLGVALKGLGRIPEALAALQAASRLEPENIDTRYNIGCLLQELDRVDEAVAAYQDVIAAAPDHTEALSNLALLYINRNRPSEALPLLRRAVDADPTFLPARINTGLALHELELYSEALSVLVEAERMAPDSAELHYNLANTLHALRRYEDAISHGGRAIRLRPDYAQAHHNLGNAWRELGESDKAVASYRRAVDLDAGHVAAWRNLLSSVLYLPDERPENRFAEHRRFARAVAPTPKPLFSPYNPRPKDQIRIGYISSDFRRHPVARNLEPIIAAHRRQGFVVALYAEVRNPDDVSARLQSMADLWRPSVGLSDEDLARQIRADNIEILVHLAGRFDRNRPAMVEQRAAPIQISLHDPATSGFAAMDYLIGDRFLIPRESSERFTERPLRLPSFYTHEPLSDAPAPGPLPAGTDAPITFGSFNHPAKLNGVVLKLWADLLRRIPGSRLMLKHRHRFSRPALQERILSEFRAAGVADERVIFLAGDQERSDHLELYRQVDIALDPFPFTGSTTTFESLWMGVPVVTLAGHDMVARWSGSILRTLKLDELTATSPESYVEIAARLAADRQRLAGLRAVLRQRVAQSPLCDGEKRADQMARLYRAVWRRWHLQRVAVG